MNQSYVTPLLKDRIMIKNIFNLGLYFEHVSKKFKSSIAIEYQDNEITFGELNDLSSKIGNFLKAEIKNSNLVL